MQLYSAGPKGMIPVNIGVWYFAPDVIKEIAALTEERDDLIKRISYDLQPQIAKLIALIDDDERAEKVIRKGATLEGRLMREAAIDSYRTMLKAALEGGE